MCWHDVQQNTDAWVQMRCGKVGGSSIGKVMAKYGKPFGDPAKQLAVKIAIEQITGQAQENGFFNEHMQRGHEHEPIARALYEEENFCTVTNGGYFENGIIGVSPDGLVDDDGIIEIKSVLPHIHYACIKHGSFDPTYKWQLYLNLKESEREWIDFVSFCADFPEGKRLFQHRVIRESCQEFFDMIDTRMNEFRQLVDEAKTTIQNL